MSKVNKNILTAFATVEDINYENMTFTVKSGIKIEEQIQSVNYTLCDLREQATRDGLIKLGWTQPQESKELLEVCQSSLETFSELQITTPQDNRLDHHTYKQMIAYLERVIKKVKGTTK